MNGKDIKLTRRRVLGGVATIGAASAAAGAGTFAVFSDTESSTSNSVSAGELNLQLNTNKGNASTHLGVTNAAPGDVGYIAFKLTNSGNVAGDLGVDITNLGETDNTRAELTDTTTGGDLADNLDVTVYVESDLGSGMSVGVNEGTSYTTSGNAIKAIDTHNLTTAAGYSEQTTSETIDNTTTKYLVFDYAIPTDAGNEVQRDKATFDIDISLTQQTA